MDILSLTIGIPGFVEDHRVGDVDPEYINQIQEHDRQEMNSHEPPTTPPTLSHPQPFRFLALPIDIRHDIYHTLLVPCTGRIIIDRNEFSPPTNWQILLVSKQVYTEARPILYSANIFTMCRELDSNNAWLTLNSMGPTNLGHHPQA